MLPDIVPIHRLETYHSQHKTYKATWDTISELREGAPAILRQPDKWLPRRPGEEEEIYRLRLAKLSYTPVMATAIREFVAKLTNSPVAISGIDPEGDFWADFFSAIDGKDQNQKGFLTQVFSSLLYFGRVYLGVDLPVTGASPRSLAEDPVAAPRVYLYEPLQVINWGEQNGQPWYLTKQINFINEPLEPESQEITWIFWTPEETVVYQSKVILDRNWAVEWVLQEGKRVRPNEALIPSRRLPQNGKAALSALVLPQELWTGAQVYLKQIQHMMIESGWTDTGTIAGSVQRVFTPPQALPADDPRFTITPPDYTELKQGNPYVLIGADFKYVEASGSAIAALTSQLETVERQIRDLVSMGYQGNQSASASGASKEVDMAILNDTMRAYGEKVALLYQDVLEAVCRVARRNEKPTVQGLDVYNANSLDAMVQTTVNLAPAEANIPATVKRIWYAKLADMLTGATSPEDKDAIEAELEELFGADRLDPNRDEDVQMVADSLGISPDEALAVLQG